MSLCHLFPLLCTSKASHFISNFLTGHLEAGFSLVQPSHTEDPHAEFCLMFGLMYSRCLEILDHFVSELALCEWKIYRDSGACTWAEEICWVEAQVSFLRLSSSCLCTNGFRSVHHAGNIHGQQVVSCAPICLMGVSAESWGQRRVASQDLGGATWIPGDDGSSCGNIRGWQQGLQESKRMRKVINVQIHSERSATPSVLRGCQMPFVQMLTLQPEHQDRIHQGQASKFCQ